MIVAAHQPHYLPWLRYVDKVVRSEVFVLLDDAQYTKNGWQNRNRIKTAQGWTYLTVPVEDPFGKPIVEVRICNRESWRRKHWNALRTNYGRAPYFRRYAEVFEAVYAREWESLWELNLHLLAEILRALGAGTQLVRSSELGVPGRATERLVAICRALGADVYLTGDYAATNHLDVGLFEEAGIEVRLQNWSCPTYRQLFPQAGFLPDLSVVDLLFNEGDRALEILMGRPDRPVPPATRIP
ncbi:MAG: WbqC family protein [Armatimonadota bacterium]|nr:WbqC family protein [Armatimonadota bacterium]MDR7443511.1 WbqC family protein [Armatimonadota bacterium]MDR7570344.1 WbqC family protein [Armatimonadota bacterium]MDR7615010.1 WbqC family protein [Armatimonadota bacterium]